MWNIKYLPGFKWTHLHERLAYEKAARRQKLRAEIQLAKKKTNFFTVNLGKSKKSKQGVNQNIVSTESEVINTDINTNSETVENRDKFIKSLFN